MTRAAVSRRSRRHSSPCASVPSPSAPRPPPNRPREVSPRRTLAFSSMLSRVVSIRTSCATSRRRVMTSSAREPAHPQVFGGNVPDDVRDVIFRSLSARDAGALACTCREFRALVSTWRARARRATFPRGRGSDAARVGAMMRSYPNVEEVSFRKLGETLKPRGDEDEEVAVRRSRARSRRRRRIIRKRRCARSILMGVEGG